MKTIKKQNKLSVKFVIKRNTNALLSSQENQLSDDAKAFRKIAHKMYVGDSIEINENQRHIIMNYLRHRNLSDRFKTRVISKKLDKISLYCLKVVTKSQLL